MPSSDGEVGHSITLGLRRQSWEATVIHACPHCEAPGVYKSDERTLKLWPGCYNPTLHDRAVGEQCPNCGKQRRKDLQLGELVGSMPLWIWTSVLLFKWVLIKTMGMFRT